MSARAVLRGAFVALLLAVARRAGDAQEALPPNEPLPQQARDPQEAPLSTVTGRVVLATDSADVRPVAGVWVALSRVGNDSAGILDSVRTGADGAYRFTYRRFGDPDAVYFTDAMYAGVGYFTPPFRALETSGDEAELVVFDTTSAPGLLDVRGRHIVVGPRLPDGRRPIVEVYELTNDSSVTVVPRRDSVPVWRATLPAGAIDPEVGDGDISASVVRFRDGYAELYAPIAPGLRQLSVRYTLPEEAFPLRVAPDDPPEVLEVLIAGSDGLAEGGGLHAEATVDIEGIPYQRYLSEQVPAGATIAIDPVAAEASREAIIGGIAATVLVLAGALVYARRTTYPSVDN